MAGQQSFDAQVGDWVAQTKERLEAVFKESAQRTISLMVKYTPVDTGFLRASVRASTSAMPKIIPTAKGGGVNVPYDSGAVLMTIAGAKLGQTIYVGYTANYARHVEYGTSKMAARRFVGRAASQWQRTVRQVSADLQKRAGAGQANPLRPR